MNQEATTAITDMAIENVLIVQTAQEVLSIKRALRRAASCAIKEVENLDRQALNFHQQKYLLTLDEGAEKQAVEKAFAAVFADFCKEQEQEQ